MEYQDEEKTCRDCERGFSFTAGEQKFFAERQFTPPVRCKQCRDTRKASAPTKPEAREAVVERVAERYKPAAQQEEHRAPKYDARQDWPDAQPTKVDRYASKRKRRRHDRDEEDDW